ncbi:hypothetical protein [Campylobacter sp. JMF_03 NE3]|uniref:hypothetical protein n=1 Tax=Campylobacter sp. JMF_03 NE3 TaxID=2983831 RepID=UPI0022E9D324|nr:hypothetical protein [Campylobacter sp. JMF_03 NE3]MDA3053514.1 hypothetical protein [Campylobacter sp. JMF_03 NE3]
MASLEVIGTITIVMVTITGFVTILLLLMPAFLYYKEFDKMEREGKSAMEVVAKVFIMHIGVTLLILFLYSALNVMYDTKGTRDFAPKYSLALFLGFYNESGQYIADPVASGRTPWKAWNSFAEMGSKVAQSTTNSNSIGANTGRVVGACMILIPLITMILWLALGFLPLFCIFYPPLYAMRKNMREQEGTFALVDKWGRVVPHIVALVLLAYIHLTIVSMFVEVQLDNATFHFWNEVQAFWAEIANGEWG